MSLATRCTTCSTVFRIVQDQLKVSEGWVRCGRCGEVFNALEGLFDLDREIASAGSSLQHGSHELRFIGTDPRDEQAPSPTLRSAQTTGLASDEVAPSSSQEDTKIDTRQSAHDEFDGDIDAGRGEAPEPDAAAARGSVAAVVSRPAPAFLRQAERAARWQQPWVRLVLLLSATLLFALLASQAALSQRDVMVARWPQTQPLLSALCEPFACRVGPLRRLDGLAVESSGLSQLDNTSLYKLQVSVRNRDTWPLVTPALELTLTDARGDVVARKVLAVRDLDPAAPSQVAADSELALQAVLDTGERRVSGYSVEIFYP